MRRFVVTNFIEDVKFFPIKIWLNKGNFDDGKLQEKWSKIMDSGFTNIINFS